MGKSEASSPCKPGLIELPGAGVMTVTGSHILLLSGGKLWRIGEEDREIVGQVRSSTSRRRPDLTSREVLV